ncbi:hypothetical protein EB796_002290 [Bugula neritina]|uniref:Uncharacterized protein n=1 Tax=Bugula neritina TaxID=10212 RepID=A0A7J7KMM1_BUGNE|nr:hypothetical protein EB796_002290 [Bugula neritina]
MYLAAFSTSSAPAFPGPALLDIALNSIASLTANTNVPIVAAKTRRLIIMVLKVDAFSGNSEVETECCTAMSRIIQPQMLNEHLLMLLTNLLSEYWKGLQMPKYLSYTASVMIQNLEISMPSLSVAKIVSNAICRLRDSIFKRLRIIEQLKTTAL